MKLENIKALRLEKKLTQIEVARQVGVTMTAYINWEKGANKPNEENLQKLTEVLEAKEK